eukprot:CAMPEP_0181452890 /NCGR_PEP_ID=MMETSP1110-20121109/29442_1 /TAXON_ID=174948 /ORGANISM="Symbiodinium sp., Strain CCMP421" /LENGTH=279 /DNA_ID=CAMNT_0023577191 /DNA_START=302 /DNA_END=1140 /DNA_ORIENTATION=-
MIASQEVPASSVTTGGQLDARLAPAPNEHPAGAVEEGAAHGFLIAAGPIPVGRRLYTGHRVEIAPPAAVVPVHSLANGKLVTKPLAVGQTRQVMVLSKGLGDAHVGVLLAGILGADGDPQGPAQRSYEKGALHKAQEDCHLQTPGAGHPGAAQLEAVHVLAFNEVRVFFTEAPASKSFWFWPSFSDWTLASSACGPDTMDQEDEDADLAAHTTSKGCSSAGGLSFSSDGSFSWGCPTSKGASVALSFSSGSFSWGCPTSGVASGASRCCLRLAELARRD